MNQILINQSKIEAQFKLALDHCFSLDIKMRKPSENPCQAIELLCGVAINPHRLVNLLQLNSSQVAEADRLVSEYAASIDNWKYSDCPLGLVDQCNILHFLLNLHKSYQDLYFFRGKSFTPELVCKFLKSWQGIDLLETLPPAVVTAPQIVTAATAPSTIYHPINTTKTHV